MLIVSTDNVYLDHERCHPVHNHDYDCEATYPLPLRALGAGRNCSRRNDRKEPSEGTATMKALYERQEHERIESEAKVL